MASEQGPTLADDEVALANYAQMLADNFAAIALVWLQRLVDVHAPGMGAMRPVVAELESGATETIADFRALLAMDISQQKIGPLEVLRRAVRFPTAILAAADVTPVPRDEFARTNFPHDVYNLTPASFGDVDPSLHEPGLTWGAAKAHVHLRRRREAESDAKERVVVLSTDLMDRSKISAAFPDAVIVRSINKLVEEAATATLVLVDLGRIQDPSVLAQLSARVVGFGSHVDDAALSAAEAEGAEALPRSVFFRRLENGDL